MSGAEGHHGFTDFLVGSDGKVEGVTFDETVRNFFIGLDTLARSKGERGSLPYYSEITRTLTDEIPFNSVTKIVSRIKDPETRKIFTGFLEAEKMNPELLDIMDAYVVAVYLERLGFLKRGQRQPDK